MFWDPFATELTAHDRHRQLLRESAERRLISAARAANDQSRRRGSTLAQSLRALLAAVRLTLRRVTVTDASLPHDAILGHCDRPSPTARPASSRAAPALGGP